MDELEVEVAELVDEVEVEDVELVEEVVDDVE